MLSRSLRSLASVWVLVCVLFAAVGCKKDGGGAATDAAADDLDGPPPVVYVESTDQTGALGAEREPNDDVAAALPVPGGVSGRIDAAGDVDRYTFRVDAPQVLRVRLTGADGADLTLELRDAGDKTLVKSDNGPAGALEGVSDLQLAPGTYELRIAEFTKKGAPARTDPSPPYELRVRFATEGQAEAGDEREPNETAAFAGALPLEGARGHIGWRKDRDVWRLEPTSNPEEASSLDVTAVEGVALELSVLGPTEERWLVRKGGKGEPVSVRNLSVPAGEGSVFVVVGTAGAGNPEVRYELTVRPVPLEVGDELEPNDDAPRANPLVEPTGVDAGEGGEGVEAPPSGTRVGFLDAADTDLYRVEPRPESRTLSLTVAPPDTVDARLAILDGEGRVVAEADAAARGAAETLADVPVAPGDAVYVRLSAKRGADSTTRYRLSWTLTLVP